MNGFQHTFHRLYQSDSMIDHESVSHSGSKKMQHFDSENMSHHPENHNHTKSYCSSGNGPSSDILIVRRMCHEYSIQGLDYGI